MIRILPFSVNALTVDKVALESILDSVFKSEFRFLITYSSFSLIAFFPFQPILLKNWGARQLNQDEGLYQLKW